MEESTADKKNKKIKNVFRFFLIVLTLLTSILILLTLENPKEVQLTPDSEANADIIFNTEATTQIFDFITLELKALEENKINALKESQFQAKVQSVENIFAKYGGYLSGYGELIVRTSEECGGDYRYIVAIAGNESGFGRINYKLYNPFGYLDGVQYSGYDEALSSITCKISQRFLVPCNHDLTCIINKYGGPDTDKEKWVRNIQSFINQL